MIVEKEREEKVQRGCKRKEKRKAGEERILNIQQGKANRKWGKVSQYLPSDQNRLRLSGTCNLHRRTRCFFWKELTYMESNSLKLGDPQVVIH